MTYYQQMYRLATSILYNEDESKDVVSEVFARLLGKDITLRKETAEAYLMMSVRNECRNVLERKHLHDRFIHLLSINATEPLMAENEVLRMEELMRYIREQLPPLSQEIFRLRYMQEMTCQEVANSLGISRQTVHVHLQQSIEKIREYFKSNR
ncbi:MAG: sigma-70 family RNA polymerase sigma factor [Prevotella sp.]|nr:sigma-70 family RNA polymerase sigma factor [Prevotella sp.]